jgi:small nuclear ribonucleoprotein (snRNP)-like protein
MVSSIVLPIKKVFSLVDSVISIEMKDDGRIFRGRLVAVDEYLNLHLEESIETTEAENMKDLGTLVIRGNNILSIAPVA